MWTTIDIFERPKRENKIKKKMKDKEITIEDWCMNLQNKDKVKFSEWLAENHYVLNNVQNGMHWWKNEYGCENSGFLYMKFEKEQTKDTIVESVIEQFKQRSEVGINKYGVTLDRTDLTRLEWLQHAQEEAMDMILYLEKLKQYEK
jgi:hypothetical protein